MDNMQLFSGLLGKRFCRVSFIEGRGSLNCDLLWVVQCHRDKYSWFLCSYWVKMQPKVRVLVNDRSAVRRRKMLH